MNNVGWICAKCGASNAPSAVLCSLCHPLRPAMNIADEGVSMKSARKAAGLTQAVVAERLGISKAAVSQWERGETEPGLANLRKLGDVLCVSIAALRFTPSERAQ